MKHKQKGAAFALAAAMMLSLFAPAATAAAQAFRTAQKAETAQEVVHVDVPAPVNAVQGDGFYWQEDTKTLTITASTGDFTSAYTDRPYQAYRNLAEKIVVDGDANTDIGDYAFNSFTKLKSVEIKNGGRIGNRAFGQCSALEQFVAERCGEIDVYAFQNCRALTDVKINTCGNIAANAFANCSGLQSVVIGVCGDLAASVFSGKSKLATVSLGTCGNIGDSAFNNCTALTSITLNCGNIGKRAFYGCTNLKEAVIENAGAIGNSAFGKTGLQTLRIIACGDIENQAFVDNSNPFGNHSLRTVEIDTCGKIGSSAFAYAKNLQTVKIGTCTSIGSLAFGFNSALQTVEVDNCASIGKNAFQAAGAPIVELHIQNCAIEQAAFYMAKIQTLTLENVSDIADAAFQSSTITNLTLSHITSLGEGVFAGCKGLTNLTIEDVDTITEGTFKIYDTTLGNNVETITLKNVNYIGNYAFYGFTGLKKVNIDGSCGYVGAHAFSGCDSLNQDGAITIADTTKLGYSNSLVHQSAVLTRVAAILQNTFALTDPQTPIDPIAPQGWTSVRTGADNATEQVGDTQLTKEAKWSDEEATIADVLIKAYYTTDRQMDFVFVVDCSNSMSGFGSADAMNSNFYNMQSKLMDVTEELLTSGLDTRVAFSTFGQEQGAVSRFYQNGEADAALDYIWNDVVNYESDTNYSTGLAGGLTLVQQNKGRNTTVIFISDGQPYCSTGEVPADYYGEQQAAAIRAEGVQIISVLQQVPQSELDSSMANMQKLTDIIFSSTDLAGFSTAVNDAIDYANTTYVLTDTIHPDFILDETSIQASAGDVVIGQDAQGNTTLTWTITGQPYAEHTLFFKENLKPDAGGAYPAGLFDTNLGDAVFNDGSKAVNRVASPVLPRGAASFTVEKRWEKDDPSERPESIEVSIFCNGTLYDTVTLNAQTQWAYAWNVDYADQDPTTFTWTVRETAVPDGYTSAVTAQGQSWTITNTRIPQPAIPVTGQGGTAPWLALTLLAAGVAAVAGAWHLARRRTGCSR